jgi:hypothetical protein
MKPENWNQLPASILNQLLWDCDLEYDGYEESKAGKINEIENGQINDTNRRIVDTAWKFMSEESYNLRLEQERDSLKEQLKLIEELLDNNRRFK